MFILLLDFVYECIWDVFTIVSFSSVHFPFSIIYSRKLNSGLAFSENLHNNIDKV